MSKDLQRKEHAITSSSSQTLAETAMHTAENLFKFTSCKRHVTNVAYIRRVLVRLFEGA